MNKLLSIYKEPGSEVPSLLLDIPAILSPGASPGAGRCASRGCTAERALPSIQAPPSFAVEPSIFQLFKRSSSDFLKLQQYFSIEEFPLDTFIYISLSADSGIYPKGQLFVSFQNSASFSIL